MTLTNFILLLSAAAVVAAVAYAYGRRSAAPSAAATPAEAPKPRTHEPTDGAATPSPKSRPAQPGRAATAAPTSTNPGLKNPGLTNPGLTNPGSVDIRSWGYQLQNLDIAHASASPFDLLVIDPAKDGDDESTLTPAEVTRLKRKPDGSRRLVVAYLSIGEAESYRGYWRQEWKRKKPAWLLAENPDWDENYAVCFWDPGWQTLMCGNTDARLDRILAAGFDGVYLDKCDVFEDMREHKMKEAKSRPDLEGDMVEFITRLSQHAKAQRPGFLVIMQNAESLLERRELRRVLDGVGKEELMFGLDGTEKRNSDEDFEWARTRLDLMRREGKFVLVVEYLNAPQKIVQAHEGTGRLGYALHISPKDRDLKKLVYPIGRDGTAVA